MSERFEGSNFVSETGVVIKGLSSEMHKNLNIEKLNIITARISEIENILNVKKGGKGRSKGDMSRLKGELKKLEQERITIDEKILRGCKSDAQSGSDIILEKDKTGKSEKKKQVLAMGQETSLAKDEEYAGDRRFEELQEKARQEQAGKLAEEKEELDAGSGDKKTDISGEKPELSWWKERRALKNQFTDESRSMVKETADKAVADSYFKKTYAENLAIPKDSGINYPNKEGGILMAESGNIEKTPPKKQLTLNESAEKYGEDQRLKKLREKEDTPEEEEKMARLFPEKEHRMKELNRLPKDKGIALQEYPEMEKDDYLTKLKKTREILEHFAADGVERISKQTNEIDRLVEEKSSLQKENLEAAERIEELESKLTKMEARLAEEMAKEKSPRIRDAVKKFFKDNKNKIIIAGMFGGSFVLGGPVGLGIAAGSAGLGKIVGRNMDVAYAGEGRDKPVEELKKNELESGKKSLARRLMEKIRGAVSPRAEMPEIKPVADAEIAAVAGEADNSAEIYVNEINEFADKFEKGEISGKEIYEEAKRIYFSIEEELKDNKDARKAIRKKILGLGSEIHAKMVKSMLEYAMAENKDRAETIAGFRYLTMHDKLEDVPGIDENMKKWLSSADEQAPVGEKNEEKKENIPNNMWEMTDEEYLKSGFPGQGGMSMLSTYQRKRNLKLEFVLALKEPDNKLTEKDREKYINNRWAGVELDLEKMVIEEMTDKEIKEAYQKGIPLLEKVSKDEWNGNAEKKRLKKVIGLDIEKRESEKAEESKKAEQPQEIINSIFNSNEISRIKEAQDLAGLILILENRKIALSAEIGNDAADEVRICYNRLKGFINDIDFLVPELLVSEYRKITQKYVTEKEFYESVFKKLEEFAIKSGEKDKKSPKPPDSPEGVTVGTAVVPEKTEEAKKAEVNVNIKDSFVKGVNFPKDASVALEGKTIVEDKNSVLQSEEKKKEEERIALETFLEMQKGKPETPPTIYARKTLEAIKDENREKDSNKKPPKSPESQEGIATEAEEKRTEEEIINELRTGKFRAGEKINSFLRKGEKRNDSKEFDRDNLLKFVRILNKEIENIKDIDSLFNMFSVASDALQYGMIDKDGGNHAATFSSIFSDTRKITGEKLKTFIEKDKFPDDRIREVIKRMFWFKSDYVLDKNNKVSDILDELIQDRWLIKKNK